MKKRNRNKKEIKNASEIKNGIANFTQSMINGAQLSQTDTLERNNRYYHLFNNRILISTLYVEHGLIQTLVDQPVDDAFRGGLEIKSKQLDDEDIKELNQYLEIEGVYKAIMQTLKWGRLYGGGGLVIMTSQPTEKEFNINRINKFSPLEFYAADLWELNLQHYTDNPTKDIKNDSPYFFYGHQLHESRVLKYKGKEAPSMIRRRFRGWGMPEIERVVRSFNQYLKNNNVIFELLDEAKLDIYKLENYNNSMIANQESTIQAQVQNMNMMKNFLNALVMDKEDDYEQKQISFAGLGDMLGEIRKGIASDLKMPVTKLFGVSSAGFNSGEDDIENYNSMIESEIRSKAKGIVLETVKIVCKKLFDIIPEDLNFEWTPLRILNAEQEENVKTSQANRLISLFSTGLITTKESKEAINKDQLIAVDIKVNDELSEDVMPMGHNQSLKESTTLDNKFTSNKKLTAKGQKEAPYKKQE